MIIGKEQPGQVIDFGFRTHDNNCYFLCLESINGVEIIKKPHATWVTTHLKRQIKSPRFKISGILFKPTYVSEKHGVLGLSIITIYFNLLATGEIDSSPIAQVIVQFLSEEYERIAEMNF